MEYSFKTLSLFDILAEARVKDELYIEKFANTMPDGTTIKKFQIVPHEDPEEVGSHFRIVHIGQESGPDGEVPKLLECTLYGEISFVNTGPYGNWVPSEAHDNVYKVKYVEQDVRKAAIVISLNAPSPIANALQVIDDEMRAYLKQTHQMVTSYNPLLTNNRYTVKYPLVVPSEDWEEYQETVYGIIPGGLKCIKSIEC